MDAQMLEGKVALITGASYGMGRTIAELFAEEGARVVLTARHAEQLNEVVEGIRHKGGNAIGVVADVCSTEDTQRVFKTATETFGDLDILVNNAGIGEQKIIDETSDEWMLHVMNTNLGGPMRYIREALKVFLPKNDGCIINISSVNGNRPFCGATYTSTKGALNTLTKKCRHAPYRHKHPLQCRCSGRHRDAGSPCQQSRRATGRQQDAQLERSFRLLPRPGMRSD